MKIGTFLLCASTIISVLSAPVAAATTYYNYARAQIYDRPNNIYLLNTVSTSTNGSSVAVAGAASDGFAAAQSTIANNGTATAAASGLSLLYDTESITELFTTFDFSPSTKGRVTIKLTGWAIANGSGNAIVTSLIRLNGVQLGFARVSSTEAPALSNGGPTTPGLRKLSLIKTINWKGGDTISILNFAYAQVYGDYSFFDSLKGPGFASAYADPAIDVTASVPEPASWAMLIAGFGLTGASMRRRAVAVV